MFGTYTEIVVPELIVYTLEWEPLQVPLTTVRVEFVALGEKTEIRLTHSGLAFPEMREEVPKGWKASFEKLETTLAQSLAPRAEG